MAWEDTLISIYLYICTNFKGSVWAPAQRLSNNADPTFTDEEVLTIYLFGIIKKKKTVSEMYEYITDHMSVWFPALPSYVGYLQRLNRLCDVFAPLLERILADCSREGVLEQTCMVDSMPIVLANAKRSSTAKVATGFANKGFCSSKNMYFHGVKLHLLAMRRPGTLPLPDYIGLTPGADNDLTVLRSILPKLHDCDLFGDKIYADQELVERLIKEQNVRLYTPIKKKKGQEHLPMTDRAFSQAVSAVRQPIESIFSWIEEKTGIQAASKVRSMQGLKVHVFGRLAAAMLLLVFYS